MIGMTIGVKRIVNWMDKRAGDGNGVAASSGGWISERWNDPIFWRWIVTWRTTMGVTKDNRMAAATCATGEGVCVW